MSMESRPYEKELHKVDTYIESLQQAERAFRSVVLRPGLLDNDTRPVYLHRLSIYQNLAVPTSRPLQMPLPNSESPAIPPFEEEKSQTEEKPKFALGYPLAGVLGIGILMTGILAFYDKIPPASLFYVIVISVSVASSSLIMSFIKDWLGRKDIEKPDSSQDQVKAAFEEMRKGYERCWKLVKIQNQNSEKLPSYQRLDVDEVVYDRGKQFAALLPFRLLELSGRVMNICMEGLQNRRDTVIFAMRDTQRATVASMKT